MRILFSTAPLFGHFSPLVALAWAFRCAGHEVLIACHGDFATTVVKAGLPASIVSDGFGTDDYAYFNGNSPGQSFDVSGRGWGGLAARSLPGMLKLIETQRPDLVISEPCEYAGRIAAAHHGIPWIQHSWGIAIPPDFATAAGAELKPELHRLGLDILPPPEAILYPCPPSLLQLDAPPGLNMRYVPYNGEEVAPEWLPGLRDRPRVFVTLGSLLPHYGAGELRSLLFQITKQVVGAGLEVILGVDKGIARSLGPMPDGVLAAGWVPLNQVLPTCDVVVHHGGMGTSSASVVYGLPQLLLPQATDQFVIADRLIACGAALSLGPDQATAAAAHESVVTLIEQSSYKAAASSLAAQVKALPTPAEIARMIESHHASPSHLRG